MTEALEKIDDVDEETFRDAKSIIELLKENLSTWKEEDGDVEDLWKYIHLYLVNNNLTLDFTHTINIISKNSNLL